MAPRGAGEWMIIFLAKIMFSKFQMIPNLDIGKICSYQQKSSNISLLEETPFLDLHRSMERKKMCE